MVPAWISNSRGEIYLNQLKRFVKGGFLVPSQALNPVTTPAGGVDPGRSPVVTLQGPQDSVTEIYTMLGYHTPTDNADVRARLQVEITDQRYIRGLMNRPVLANHVFGTSQFPNYMIETLYLEGQQNLAFQFFNPSAAGDSHFAINTEIRKLIDINVNRAFVTRFLKETRRRKALLYPYWLTSDAPISVPAGATRDYLFTTTADIMLVLFQSWCTALTTGAAGDLQELVGFEFFNPKNGRPLQNSYVTMNCCTGNAQNAARPFKFPCPLMVEPATIMRVRITNLVTDAPTEVFLTFQGVAYFQGNGPWQYSDQSEKLSRGTYTEVPAGKTDKWTDYAPQSPEWPLPAQAKQPLQ
jgi:hypothetical protein